MELEFESIPLRIEKVAKRTKQLCEFHAKAEKAINFVRTRPWLRNNPKAEGHVDIYTTDYTKRVQFHISNVPLEEFIENILGPFHLRFKLNWRLEIEGTEEEPVLQFTDIANYSWESWVKFRIKEKEFKTCQIIKKFKGISKGHITPSEPMYDLEMRCE